MKAPEQAERLIKAHLAYKEAAGQWPTAYEMNNALRLFPDDDTSGMSDVQLDNQSAMERIVHGALQIATSTLLAQPLQISAGCRTLRPNGDRGRKTVTAKPRLRRSCATQN